MNDFAQVLKRHFSGYLEEGEFVARSGDLLQPLGFTAENGFACVATCRDELCVPLRQKITKKWGEAFNFASLGGMIFVGRTGFAAAHSHAPEYGGRRRHIYFALPHVGVEADGTPGLCSRPGIAKPSSACGALLAFRDRLQSGQLEQEIALEDIEQSLLQIRLAPHIEEEEVPDPIELTLLAEQVIRSDLERAIAATVDVAEVDYAVFTGVQIHGPDQRHYVWPSASYAVIEGERREL